MFSYYRKRLHPLSYNASIFSGFDCFLLYFSYNGAVFLENNL